MSGVCKHLWFEDILILSSLHDLLSKEEKMTNIFIKFGILAFTVFTINSYAEELKLATNKFGALAVDRQSSFVYGFSHDHSTREKANERASEECVKRKGSCEIVIEFSGSGCAAYHTIDVKNGSAYGWAADGDKAKAQAKSKEYCQSFSNGTPCSNFAWACNSQTTTKFRSNVEPVLLAQNCYVQFEVNIETPVDNDWVGRFSTPVYQLKASDCPVSGDSEYFGYIYYGDLPKYKADENAKKDPTGKGQKMAQEFYNWIITKRSPYSGTKLRAVGSVSVTQVKPNLLNDLLQNVRELDAGITQKSLPGARLTCFDFKFSEVTPVNIFGSEYCQQWIR